MKKYLCTASMLLVLSAGASMADDTASGPLAFPATSSGLNVNSSPYTADAGPLGNIHVNGVLSGLAFVQSNETAADDGSHLDLSNGFLFVQKNEGLVQFYAQAGGYSIPVLGTAYTNADDTIDNLYGVLPVAYATLAPTEQFSLSVGKLPTLIGVEYTFTFQNINIQRGLLWNQENAVNRGVQLNYTGDALVASVAYGDGFYSDDYNWLSGFLGYTFNENHAVAFSGGGNLDESSRSTLATPLLQNNSQIYTAAYTYTQDKWTVTPYVQYNHVDEDRSLGIIDDGSTFGVAVLGKYQFTDKISVAGRAEHISSSGNTSLLYGVDSDAWSLTLTPTYQEGVFFGRVEASYVGLQDHAAGAGFGDSGNEDDQARLLLEAGLYF
jgi:hypothetical protein